MSLSVSRGIEELASLSSCYAIVTSSPSPDSSTLAAEVCIEIPPAADLFITTSIPLVFSFPVDYPRAPLSITTSSRDVFLKCNCLISDEGVISLPWEQQSKYSAGVLFHGVRNLLRQTSLPPYITPPLFAAAVTINSDDLSNVSLIAGSGSTKGRRPYMEDVAFLYPDISVTSSTSVSVFGVLDGHGGDDCAKFAAEELTPQLVSHLRGNAASNCAEDVARCLYESFLNTDAAYLKHRSSNAGCTATVLLFHHAIGVASLAHCGDTRAVIGRVSNDKLIAVDLSRDMKATCPLEVARIAEAGGFISNGRVLGSLAVARALGNAPLKETPQEKNKILIAAPEVTTFRFKSADRLMIIATDGLWDVMSSQAAVDMAVSLLAKRGIALPINKNSSISSDLKSVAETMAQHAVTALRSADNVTVMILIVTRDTLQPGYSALSVSNRSNQYAATPIFSLPSTIVQPPVATVTAAAPPLSTSSSSAIEDDDLMRFLQDDENF